MRCICTVNENILNFAVLVMSKMTQKSILTVMASIIARHIELRRAMKLRIRFTVTEVAIDICPGK